MTTIYSTVVHNSKHSKLCSHTTYVLCDTRLHAASCKGYQESQNTQWYIRRYVIKKIQVWIVHVRMYVRTYSYVLISEQFLTGWCTGGGNPTCSGSTWIKMIGLSNHRLLPRLSLVACSTCNHQLYHVKTYSTVQWRRKEGSPVVKNRKVIIP